MEGEEGNGVIKGGEGREASSLYDCARSGLATAVMGALEIHKARQTCPEVQCKSQIAHGEEKGSRQKGKKWWEEVAQSCECIMVCLVPHSFLSRKIAGLYQNPPQTHG